jgi:hypothetical protein
MKTLILSTRVQALRDGVGVICKNTRPYVDKGWVARGDFLDEELFGEEGKL